MRDEPKNRPALSNPQKFLAQELAKTPASSVDPDAAIAAARRTLVEWLRSMNESKADSTPQQ